MISGLEMPKITYVHTAQRETTSIHEALEKAVMTEKMKLILKVEPSCISARYWTQGSRSSTSGQHASTLTIHNCAQSVHSCVRLHDMKTDMKGVVQSKVRSELGLAAVT